MPVLGWIVLFTVMGGLVSALAASLFLVVSDKWRRRALPHLISFATGSLLGAAFLGLLPHALESAGPERLHEVGLAVLAGILLFFVLEKLVLWRHCHADHCDVHAPEDHHRDAASGTMILAGDALHNLLDGVLIAAAFVTDLHLGVVTALAVIAHEVPQEVGDLAVLLNGGMSRRRALGFNVLVSLTTVVGGVIAYYWLDNTRAALPYALAIAASSFIYVAVADLIPGLHRQVNLRESLGQFVLIGAGTSVIFLTHATLH